MHGTCATLRLKAFEWHLKGHPARCSCGKLGAGFNSTLQDSTNTWNEPTLRLKLIPFNLSTFDHLQILKLLFFLGGEKEWVSESERVKKKTINFNSNKWHLNHPKCCILRCFGFFVAQDSVEALRTASERQARLGPPHISIFASRRAWGVSLVLHEDLKAGSWRWYSSLVVQLEVSLAICFCLSLWDVCLVSEVRRIHEFRDEVSGDFFARLWKESQLPSQGGRWRAKIALAEYISETCKSNTVANWPSKCETQGAVQKVFAVFL